MLCRQARGQYNRKSEYLRSRYGSDESQVHTSKESKSKKIRRLEDKTDEIDSSLYSYYPDSIPVYEVRKDVMTGEPVSRGRLHLIHENVNSQEHIDHDGSERVSFRKFRELLQCAPTEPDIDSQHGGISLLKLAKLSLESTELACAWIESGCNPWQHCRETMEKYKRGEYPKPEVRHDGAFIELLRVINGELHGDWPWGQDRGGLGYKLGDKQHWKPFHYVVRSISDWRDSIFFLSGESSYMRFNFPFPSFSNGPRIGYNDIAFPWHRPFEAQILRYHIALTHNNFSDSFYLHHNGSHHHEVPWQERIPKAAYFSTINDHRLTPFDQAVLRPDLFDASYSNPWGEITNWNPLAPEHVTKVNENHIPPRRNDSKPGEADYIFPLMTHRSYNPAHYKYVIVSLGGVGAPSDRLENVLAYSGAVVLLEESEWTYHFSAHMQPWVHYVPISYNMADLIDKVQWLHDHDDMAQQIARNGLNFGKSHLRLEDSYCFMAAALKSVESVVAKTDAVKPWNPWKLV